MNFDEIFEKIESGTATDEEKAFFNSEIDKLRRIRSIIDESPTQPVIEEADTETVMKARKRFNHKTTIRIIVITMVSILVIAAIACGIIFIPSCTSAARHDNVGREEAISLAYGYLGEFLGEDASNYSVHDCDKELRIHGRLNDATYVYEVELRSPDGSLQYEMDVNTKSGYVSLEDVDHRN